MKFKNKTCLLILTVIMAFSCAYADNASDGRVEFLGEYNDVSLGSDGEHCGGYNIMVWKYQETLIGFLNFYAGQCFDPPMGAMEEVSYSAQTGSLSFKAKLSVGCSSDGAAGECAPSKDIIEFKGSLREETLEGAVKWYKWYSEGMKPSYPEENVALAKENESLPSYGYETYADWEKYWEPILKARGPRW